ncbi:MAG: sigma factor-like helix-turn-helix DNA-binding protein [Polyangiaceae bacterium]
MSADSPRKHQGFEAAARADGPSERPPSSRQATRRRSIRVARATRQERAYALSRARELEQRVERPRERRECEDGPRPCPFVACRHHLYLDVSPSTGTIKLNFPELEVWELGETCALDVAAAGGHGPEQTSVLLNVTRERVRQIEVHALSKLKSVRTLATLGDAEAEPREAPALRARSRAARRTRRQAGWNTYGKIAQAASSPPICAT